MIMNFDILYKNGHSEVIVQEADEETLSKFLSTFNENMVRGIEGVVRFNTGSETNMVRVDDVSRLKIEVVEK